MQRDFLQFDQEGPEASEGAFVNPATGRLEYTIVRDRLQAMLSSSQ